jgi:hypothetical protein
LVLVYVYQKIHNPQQAKRAFVVSSQHCNADSYDGSTISFEKIMAQCYSDISKTQLDLMKSKASYFVQNYILSQGRVPHEILLEHGLTPTYESINRDDLAAMRHSSEIISHDETLERLREFQHIRSKEYLDKKKAEAQAEKVILKDIKERQLAEEKEEKALQKKKKLVEEKERVNSMTKEERMAHAAEKKALQQQKKEERSLKRQRESEVEQESLKRAREILEDVDAEQHLNVQISP